MSPCKRRMTLYSFIAVAVLIGLFAPLPATLWQSYLAIPQGTLTAFPNNINVSASHQISLDRNVQPDSATIDAKRVFLPGNSKPIGQRYSRTLVVPRTKLETTNWINENFNQDPDIDWKVYVVDLESAPLHPPKNKGNEAMVYLSYIIDYYHNLSDVNIFMHAHRYAWHNNDLLGNDAVELVSRLSSERVQREGYVNLRCSWDPGCPAWMRPGTIEEDVNKQEETMLARFWSELFPQEPIPIVLAQPCCAQFAISGDRIRNLPLTTYTSYRDWLLKTNLSDYLSGRVFEYVWHFIFTGRNVVCSKEHICYCDGFGICFGGEKEFDAYNEKTREHSRLEKELAEWVTLNTKWDIGNRDSEQPEAGKREELQSKIQASSAWCTKTKQDATDRGDIPMNRAQEAGRSWKDGDGF
ncbi:hypothetical protein PZA11_002157 [Diplocarpon coronariae]|uniref:Uncharacterized protein n=1 Tax=Diplocarpon coronariae TaxID=2795749 RepID=A0A218ZF22_9HELO|nr:hypothetical protein JHW43_006786 [Diplocarpon mali]OWP06190.1 hypothetical protein B2J93_829 [Marssonina coronariae]